MRTPHLLRRVPGALAVLVCGLSITSCADLARTGRGPAYLIINRVQATPGGGVGATGSSLDSDVSINGIAFIDLGLANISAQMKNALSTTAPSPLNSITLNRYRVRFRRTDGQNREGIDVPYGFDGATTITIRVGEGKEEDVTFDLVRPQAKLEPPLRNLAGAGGLIIISTIAEITFYGRDQAGNEISVSGAIDVRFGDF